MKVKVASIYVGLAAVLLILSFVLLYVPTVRQLFGDHRAMYTIQLLVIISCISGLVWAGWRRNMRLSFLSTLRMAFPIWIVGISVLVGFAVVPIWTQDPLGFGNANGKEIHQQSWNEKEGRYFMVINDGVPFEINKEQYSELNQKMFTLFARGWVMFSFVSLVLSQYVRKKELLLESNKPSPIQTL